MRLSTQHTVCPHLILQCNLFPVSTNVRDIHYVSTNRSNTVFFFTLSSSVPVFFLLLFLNNVISDWFTKGIFFFCFKSKVWVTSKNVPYYECLVYCIYALTQKVQQWRSGLCESALLGCMKSWDKAFEKINQFLNLGRSVRFSWMLVRCPHCGALGRWDSSG